MVVVLFRDILDLRMEKYLEPTMTLGPHGHINGEVGVLKYGVGDARETLGGSNKPPATTNTTRNRWVAICGTNKGNDAYFVNGVGLYCRRQLFSQCCSANIGDEPSNWAVAFLATWNYHVGEARLSTLSNWLNPAKSATPYGFVEHVQRMASVQQ